MSSSLPVKPDVNIVRTIWHIKLNSLRVFLSQNFAGLEWICYTCSILYTCYKCRPLFSAGQRLRQGKDPSATNGSPRQTYVSSPAGSLNSFYMQKGILSIFYFRIISLICTVFKLSCPAHLFPNTLCTSLPILFKDDASPYSQGANPLPPSSTCSDSR